MNQINICPFKTPFGELILGSFNDKVCLCCWRRGNAAAAIRGQVKSKLRAVFVEKDHRVLKTMRRQLNEYFSRERKTFDIPILMAGSEFQISVWKSLPRIPFGKTSSYMEVARKISAPRAVRAVANANRANPVSIFVPCHRVIGNDGRLTGYSGGLLAKKKLLEMERAPA